MYNSFEKLILIYRDLQQQIGSRVDSNTWKNVENKEHFISGKEWFIQRSFQKKIQKKLYLELSWPFNRRHKTQKL